MTTTETHAFEVLLDDLDVTEEEVWLEARQLGITGTDAPAILGVSRYATAETVYLEKVGQYRRVVDNDAAEAGKRLEDVVRQWTGDLLGADIVPWKKLLRSREHPFMLASPDGRVGDSPIGYEGKTAGAFLADEWADGNVPLAYQAQVQHYMAVTGFGAWVVGVLIGGQKPLVHVVDRDDAVIEALVEAEGELWDRVQRGEPPTPDWTHPATTELIKARYGDLAPGGEIELDPSVTELLAVRRTLKAAIAERESALEGVENQLKAMLAEHEVGTLGGVPVVTWKPVTTNRLDTKALETVYPAIAAQFKRETTSRRLWVPKAKEAK